MTPCCLHPTELAKYNKTKLVLNMEKSGSSCHEIEQFQPVVLKRTAQNCAKMRAAGARLFVFTEPIKSFFLASSSPFRCLMRNLNL